MARSNDPCWMVQSARSALRIVAYGFSAAAMRALIGSSSTPDTCAATSSGMPAMKLPVPHPGSSTWMGVGPMSSASHMALTTGPGV